MDRMKTFLIYLLIFVSFYFFVDFASFAYIKTTYEDLTKFTIDVSNPKLKITEGKATFINGYIKGNYLNNSEEKIEKEYLKFEFFSENDVLLGRKYVKIENLEPNEVRDFETRFNLEGVDHYKVLLSNDIEDIKKEELELDAETKGLALITLLLFLYF